jgi:hypothetical protein
MGHPGKKAADGTPPFKTGQGEVSLELRAN